MRQKFSRKAAFRPVVFRTFVFRTVAVLLLGVRAGSAMDAALPVLLLQEPFADLASQPAPPAGCHRSESLASPPLPVVPATIPPAPRSYQCCVAGHHAAIPFAPFSFLQVLAHVGDASGAGQFSLLAAVHFLSIVLISPFGSPPGSFSLRI